MSEVEIIASFSSNTPVIVSSIDENIEPIHLIVSPTALPYSNNSQRKVFSFSWGDASPLLITQVQGIVTQCDVTIVEPFDVPSSLNVGSNPTYSDVFPVFPGLTLQEPGVYQSHPLVEFESIQQVFLQIFPGVGCSLGRGVITIDWSEL